MSKKTELQNLFKSMGHNMKEAISACTTGVEDADACEFYSYEIETQRKEISNLLGDRESEFYKKSDIIADHFACSDKEMNIYLENGNVTEFTRCIGELSDASVKTVESML